MLIPIDRQLLDTLSKQASNSPRRRFIHRFHEHPDPVQRMINVVEPDSYVMPHKHEDPDKVEAFIILQGKAAIISFDDSGTIQDCVIIDQNGPAKGVEIVPRTWHCVLSLEPGTALYEVLEGPYETSSHKAFAEWAPPADDFESGLKWLNTSLQQYYLQLEQRSTNRE